MENTKFMKNLVEWQRYDKHNSIPFLLAIVLTVITISGMVSAAVLVENEDMKIAASKDVVMLSLVFIIIFKNCVNPENVMAMLNLLEEECSVNVGDFEGREELWKKIKIAYERNIEGMILIDKYIRITFVIMFSAFIIKNAVAYLLRISIYSDSQSLPWVTPFLWFTESEFKASAYFFSIYFLQVLVLGIGHIHGYLVISSVTLSIEKSLADFNSIYIFLENFDIYFPVASIENREQHWLVENENMYSLKKSMAKIVQCHQRICRNHKICARKSAFILTCTVCATMTDSCNNAFFVLKAQGIQKAVTFVIMFILLNLVIFFMFQNGQKIMNQNDVLRRHLAEIPWVDKPRWFRQTVHTMMTRANVDIEMKPYGIYVLNYLSFKDMMKLFFSVGNVLYSRKLANQS